MKVHTVGKLYYRKEAFNPYSLKVLSCIGDNKETWLYEFINNY